VPRPPNAFILFRAAFIRSDAVAPSPNALSETIGRTWQDLPEDERRVWRARARQASEAHRRRFPGYAFSRLQRRARGGED
ncbi:hypothetical protein DFH06DRAFT_996851, partial [Mycena polygramma]